MVSNSFQTQKQADQAGSGKKSLNDWLDELDSLKGLASVKKEVRLKSTLLKGMAERNLGVSGDFGTLHMVFRGNAGTGKTTVARILGGIYGALGLLPNGDVFVECGRSDLVGEYQGQTAPKVEAKVAEAIGGVLFIDQAYNLCQDDRDLFGAEAVNSLIAGMEDHRGELMVILSGYSKDMDRFLAQNQVLAVRMTTSLIFEDYTQEEMLQIFRGMLTDKGYVLSAEAEEPVRRVIARRFQTKDFGNARGVRNIVEEMINRHNARMGEIYNEGGTPSDEELITIIPKDLREI